MAEALSSFQAQADGPPLSPSSTAAAGAFCPCCGGPIEEANDLLVFPAARTVLRAGRRVRLKPLELRLLEMLRTAYPSFVAADDLHKQVQPGSARPIRVAVAEIRPKLKPLGLSIENVWGGGYRLVMRAPR